MPGKGKKQAERLTMASNTIEIARTDTGSKWEDVPYSFDYYSLLFVQSGNAEWSVAGKEYLVTAGDVFLLGPGEVFRVPTDQDLTDREWVLLRINRSFLRTINMGTHDLTRCFDSSLPGHSYLLHPDGINREMLSYFLELIDRELRSEAFGAEMHCAGALLQMLVILNRLAIAAAREPDARTGADSVVYRVLNYINEYYMEDLSLDFLANRFFISKYHLSREFSNLMGSSVHRYIVQKRLDLAKQMMSAGVPISEVCQHCGFGDYSNFYRAFRGKYRISPREYVENLKKETAHRKNG